MNVFEAIRESGIAARKAAEHCGIKMVWRSARSIRTNKFDKKIQAFQNLQDFLENIDIFQS